MPQTFISWALLMLGLLTALQLAHAQDYDFSAPIKCYVCEGPADNSSCADPFDAANLGENESQKCDRGMCLKWTKYRDGVLQMVRECTANLHFHLTMIDGVCRTERNGNGYLCMCGKSMCNSASHTFSIPGRDQTVSELLSFWLTFGVFSLLPQWMVHSFC